MANGTIKKGSLVKNTGGSGGGGSASFPTIVTDSGSSLPASSGYQLNDTFLDTTDKKIYKTVTDGYAINPSLDTTISDGLLNTTEGILDGFYSGNRKFTINNIQGNSFKIIIPFKTSSDIQAEQYIFQLINADSSSSIEYLRINANSNGSIVNSTNANYWNWYVEANKSYVFEITWTAGSGNNYSGITKLYDENGVQIGYEKQDSGTSSSTKKIQLGAYLNSTSSFKGQILKNIGDYNFSFNDTDIIVPNVVWDTGTDLTDKTEVADKTNGALYLYENSELVKIGGSLTKKVYTISADNTSTLDVSSDFTKIVDVLKNGVELALTDDYTISSGVITFVTALSTTDKITIKGE